jgi:hypothetical protein
MQVFAHFWQAFRPGGNQGRQFIFEPHWEDFDGRPPRTTSLGLAYTRHAPKTEESAKPVAGHRAANGNPGGVPR